METVGVALLTLAHEVVRPTDNGPRCPDCEYAPDPGPDGECDECAHRALQRMSEDAIYGSGFEDGQRATDDEAGRI